jgi:hypothetical protein
MTKNLWKQLRQAIGISSFLCNWLNRLTLTSIFSAIDWFSYIALDNTYNYSSTKVDRRVNHANSTAAAVANWWVAVVKLTGTIDPAERQTVDGVGDAERATIPCCYHGSTLL